ncbi:MAG: hypothetical protein EON59_09415 [Alphaproteobacteria bacterium]|nr:MAG: hypothetical protein EON59_09415 [Alphaproteobacteria bacterium]
MEDASINALFAPELILCVAAGGDINVSTLFSVARRVGVEGAADRSPSGWDRLPPAHPDKVDALRVAHAALARSPER